MQQKMVPQVRSSQGGYALIAVMLATIVVSALMMMVFKLQARQADIEKSMADGTQVAQFATGLRGFIAATQQNPALLPGAAKTGVNWLKPAACGGLATNPAEGYVPCAYSGGPLGKLFSTTFTRVVATNYIEARTVFVVPSPGDPKAAVMRAERVAQAALAGQTAASGTFFVALANAPAAAAAPVSPAAMAVADRGRVILVASNAPTNDIFLRTDGTNMMLANLNMGGMSIGNARDGRFTGDVRIEARAQIDQGLTVQGPSDLRGGIVTNDIALTSIGKYATEGIYGAIVLTGATSYSVPKPNCATAGNNPGIYVAMQGTGSVNQGAYAADAIYEARVDVADAGANWTVTPVVQGTRFDMAISGNNLSFNKTVVAANPADMRIVTLLRCR